MHGGTLCRNAQRCTTCSCSQRVGRREAEVARPPMAAQVEGYHMPGPAAVLRQVLEVQQNGKLQVRLVAARASPNGWCLRPAVLPTRAGQHTCRCARRPAPPALCAGCASCGPTQAGRGRPGLCHGLGWPGLRPGRARPPACCSGAAGRRPSPSRQTPARLLAVWVRVQVGLVPCWAPQHSLRSWWVCALPWPAPASGGLLCAWLHSPAPCPSGGQRPIQQP